MKRVKEAVKMEDVLEQLTDIEEQLNTITFSLEENDDYEEAVGEAEIMAGNMAQLITNLKELDREFGDG